MFTRAKGSVKVSLEEEAADLLRSLVKQYQELLEGDHEPGDKIMERLFPPASIEDSDVDKKFRDLSIEDLSNHKRETVDTAFNCLGEDGPWTQTLAPEQSESWLVLLTDIRLAIATRLDVTEEHMNLPVDPDDPTQWPMAVLHYLGALQESLVAALSP